jgi:deazaflavin-dependent oxidoreductase (nitroreductase family)
MDDRVRKALKVDMTVEITTVGRRTALPRRIEIWSHTLEGRVILTGTPGKRGWYANLQAHPEFTYHLKDAVQADLRATARPIRSEAGRRAVITKLKAASPWWQRQGLDIEAWVKGSPLVEVTFLGPAAEQP